jgi:hypothetical protein
MPDVIRVDIIGLHTTDNLNVRAAARRKPRADGRKRAISYTL